MSKKEPLPLSKKNMIIRIFKYLLKSKYLVVLSIVITLLLSYTQNIGPMISKDIIDDVLGSDVSLDMFDKFDVLNKNMWLYILAVGSSIILRYLSNILFSLTSMKLERDIRVDAMEKCKHYQ